MSSKQAHFSQAGQNPHLFHVFFSFLQKCWSDPTQAPPESSFSKVKNMFYAMDRWFWRWKKCVLNTPWELTLIPSSSILRFLKILEKTIFVRLASWEIFSVHWNFADLIQKIVKMEHFCWKVTNKCLASIGRLIFELFTKLEIMNYKS